MAKNAGRCARTTATAEAAAITLSWSKSGGAKARDAVFGLWSVYCAVTLASTGARNRFR